MSAYYGWVNATKMEYLGNGPFACSVGIVENCHFPNDRTDVALTLLASRWHGDLVAYVSDYTHLEKLEGKGFRRMAELIPENPLDYIEDNGTDVGGLFSCFKGEKWYFPTEDDPDAEFMHPYQGPFDQEPTFYRYVVNETRKEYIDRMGGRLLSSANGKTILEDVIPAILGDTNYLDHLGQEVSEGPWVGEVVAPANDRPGPDFTDVTQDYTICF